VTWSRWQPLAAIEKGHYAVSEVTPQRAGMAFNYHPDPLGLNYRTNLYYIETTDLGETWHAADGTTVRVPLTEKHNPCLVHDYEAEGWKVYMKDLVFDDGYPVILYILSRGFMPGPDSGPRIWMTARWTA